MKNPLAIAPKPQALESGWITANNVVEACEDALAAEHDYVFKALLAGCRLLEFRDFIGNSTLTGRTSHSGKSSHAHGRNQHSDGDGFLIWLAENDLPKSTAYRWMDAAKAVVRKILGIDPDQTLVPYIDVESEVIPLSQALIGPEDRLPKAALKFREGLVDFVADKTLAEAVRAALEGESAASRILRAANGQEGGTNGEDRKDFPFYAAKALKNFLAHVGASDGKKGGHWEKLSETAKHKVCEYVGLAVRGMSDELLEFNAAAAAEELKARKKGNTAQPLALKAALQKR